MDASAGVGSGGTSPVVTAFKKWLRKLNGVYLVVILDGPAPRSKCKTTWQRRARAEKRGVLSVKRSTRERHVN